MGTAINGGGTHSGNDGRQEERKRVERPVSTHVNDHVEPRFPIRDRSPEVRHVEILMLGRRLLVRFQTSKHPAAVIRRKECRLVREIIHHPKRRNPHQDRRQTLEDENPGPAVLASYTAHLTNCCREKTAKRTGDGSRGEEDGGSNPKFASLVPAGEVVVDPREQTSFGQTKEKPRRVQTLVVVHQTHRHHHDAPDGHNRRDEDAGS